MSDFRSWTYYRVGEGQAAQAMGLAPGSVIGVPADDAQHFHVLKPAGLLSHGSTHDGPTLLAELIAAGDVSALTVPIA
jgi:hypothetical protein